jgi:cytochrome P450
LHNGDQVTTHVHTATGTGDQCVDLRDPYPFFAEQQADRELIGRAIEEGLRFETPLTTVQRFTTQDTELEGVTIPARSAIGVCMGSANRDERRWERSAEFDIFRKHTPHISFAAGEHACLALHLARLETRVTVDCLLSRLSNVKLVTDGDLHVHGQPFRSPTALPVTFDAN